jgi:hypothetical protein
MRDLVEHAGKSQQGPSNLSVVLEADFARAISRAFFSAPWHRPMQKPAF